VNEVPVAAVLVNCAAEPSGGISDESFELLPRVIRWRLCGLSKRSVVPDDDSLVVNRGRGDIRGGGEADRDEAGEDGADDADDAIESDGGTPVSKLMNVDIDNIGGTPRAHELNQALGGNRGLGRASGVQSSQCRAQNADVGITGEMIAAGTAGSAASDSLSTTPPTRQSPSKSARKFLFRLSLAS
jgi:hypothetical protein